MSDVALLIASSGVWAEWMMGATADPEQRNEIGIRSMEQHKRMYDEQIQRARNLHGVCDSAQRLLILQRESLAAEYEAATQSTPKGSES